MPGHTVKGYDDELEALHGLLVALGTAAADQVDRAMQALVARDAAGCQAVIEEDARLDAWHHEVLAKEQSLLSRRQPVGVDLRQIVALARMSRDLERVGDHAKGVARRGLMMLEDPELPALPDVAALAAAASEALTRVVEALRNRDERAAREVWGRDDRIDEIYRTLFESLLAAMQRDPRIVAAGARMLFVAKSRERCGDHATNVAEDIVYWRTGELIDAARPRVDDA